MYYIVLNLPFLYAYIIVFAIMYFQFTFFHFFQNSIVLIILAIAPTIANKKNKNIISLDRNIARTNYYLLGE